MRFISSLLCLVFLCFGCSQPKNKVRLLLDWWPNPNHIPLYVGVQKKIFEAHGIDLTLFALQDPPKALTYLKTEQTDLVIYYFPQTVRAQSKDPTLDIIGILIGEPLQGFVSLKPLSIASFKQYRFGTYSEGMTLALLKHFQCKQVKLLEFDLNLALSRHLIDVASGLFWNIEPHQLRAQGIEPFVLKLKDLGFPHYPELVVVARKGFPLKEAFQAALQASIDECKAHPDEALAIYFSMNPDKSSATRKWETPAWKETLPLLSQQQTINPATVEAFLDWMENAGLL